MAKIILRDIYPYELPPVPRDEREILFYDKPRSQQYWTRQPLPNFRGLSTAKKTAFIEEEWRRLDEGLWMMIDGEPTHITPAHYDFLQYSNIPDFGVPRYYDSQRIDFYFKDLIHKDDRCFGELTMKPRRYGYTGMTLIEVLHEGISDFGRNVGMVSANFEKAKETLFRPLRDSFLTRPKYCRPEIYLPNGRPPQKELRFNSNTVEEDEEEEGMFLSNSSGMGSWIVVKGTTVKVFDGHKWHEVILDELFKWTEASVYNTWNVTKEALAVGGKICGKAHCFASMGDDETMEDAVKDAIKLWGESDYHERTKFDRTKSGLYRWFVPANAAYEMFIDKYGKCNEALATEYLLEERSRYEEGTQDYIFHVRKYPLTPEEAMSSVENTTMFSAIRLNARVSKIYVMSRTAKPYTVGNFDEDPRTDLVKFVPDVNGFWKLTHHPHPTARNRCRRINGIIRPPRNPEGVIGNDPTRTADNVSGHISMNAAYVYQKFDYYNTGTANQLLAQMYGRDEDVDITNRQIALASLYYGYPVMTERQVTSTFDFFRLNGMQEFLLKSEYDKATGLWMAGNVINDGIELIQALIRAPKKDKDGTLIEEDLLELVNYEELLIQLKNFKKSQSTKFDCVMALICTLIGAKQIKYTLVTDAANKRRAEALAALHPSR